MWLTCWKNCLVPRQWMHDYNIKNYYENETLKDLMIDHYMPVPKEW